jgi:hypothetical protein
VLSQVVNAPVAKAATATTLVSSANPAPHRQPVTFTVTVSRMDAMAGTPTGTVTIREGNRVLGTATLVNGQASIVVSTLSPGSHDLTAVYSSDDSYAGSSSAVLTQEINRR